MEAILLYITGSEKKLGQLGTRLQTKATNEADICEVSVELLSHTHQYVIFIRSRIFSPGVHTHLFEALCCGNHTSWRYFLKSPHSPC